MKMPLLVFSLALLLPAFSSCHAQHQRDCSDFTVLSDMNGDGIVTIQDINPFVLGLVDPAEYNRQYPDIDLLCVGDLNQDGSFNFGDIDPFITVYLGASSLGSGAAIGVPEPTGLSALLFGLLGAFGAKSIRRRN